VDDDPYVCKALRRLLRSSGYAVDMHVSGAEFLRQLAQRTPDCVVLDMHMPDMNGFEVQAEIRHRGIDTPVIIMSGHATPGAYSEALASGACAYICKPIDAADLLGAIHGALLSSRV
jgi:FixJ family two-component response regulator